MEAIRTRPQLRRDDDQPFEAVLDLGGELGLGPRETGLDLVLVEEVEGRDVPAADPLERRLAVDPLAPRVPQSPDVRESSSAQLAGEDLGRREPREVDLEDRREEAVQPVRVKVRGVEGREDEPSTGAEHAAQLGERARAVEDVDDDRQESPLGPDALKGKLL